MVQKDEQTKNSRGFEQKIEHASYKIMFLCVKEITICKLQHTLRCCFSNSLKPFLNTPYFTIQKLLSVYLQVI